MAKAARSDGAELGRTDSKTTVWACCDCAARDMTGWACERRLLDERDESGDDAQSSMTARSAGRRLADAPSYTTYQLDATPKKRT